MNLNNRALLLFVLLIALVLGFAFWTGERPVSQEAPAKVEKSIAQPTSIPSPLLSVTPQASLPSDGPQGPLELPSMREVREQVAQDPHHTPPALLQFAKELSAHAQDAKKSPESAQAFFETLENCVQSGKEESESVPVAAQTLCLTTAEEFATLYPNELGPRLLKLQQNASPEAKRIRNALNQL